MELNNSKKYLVKNIAVDILMNKLLSALQYLSRVRVQDMKYQNNDVIPEYFLIKVTLGYKGRLGSRG